MASERLQSIQVLRAVAVVPVIFFHFSDSPHGRAGVDLFFVISGFVMAGLMDRSPGRFALDRFTRIYPPFLAALALTFILFPQPVEADRLALSLMLWPGQEDIYLYPAWSLGYEAMFYAALVASMFLGGRAVLVAFAALFVLGVPYAGSAMCLEFLAGFAIARKQWWALPLLLLAATVSPRVLLYGPAAAALVWLCTRNEAWFRHRFWAPVAMLGDASYSIYLVHLPVGSKLVQSVPVAAVIYGCIAAGLAFHFTVEKPLLRACRGALRRLGSYDRGKAAIGRVKPLSDT